MISLRGFQSGSTRISAPLSSCSRTMRTGSCRTPTPATAAFRKAIMSVVTNRG